MKNRKIGRNEKCPCGSGKKYKKCCIGKDIEGMAAGEPGVLTETEQVDIPAGNLKKFLTKKNGEIEKILSEKKQLFSKHGRNTIREPGFMEFSCFIHFKNDKGMKGEKVMISGLVPYKLENNCICGNGKEFGNCCFKKVLNRQGFAVNYDRKTFDILNPKEETIETENFELARETLLDMPALLESENSENRCFLNFVGEELLLSELGTTVFGTVELTRKPDGKGLVKIEAATGKRHELIKERVLDAIEISGKEKLFEQLIKKASRATNLHDFKKAEGFIEHALEIFPDDPEALNEKARMLGISGDGKAATEIIDKLLKEHGDDPAVYGNKGLFLMNQEKHDEAMVCLEKAIELDPDAVPAINNKGAVHLIKRETKKAIECFDSALEKDNDNVFALTHKGKALELQGKKREAGKCFEKAMKIDAMSYFELYAGTLPKRIWIKDDAEAIADD